MASKNTKVGPSLVLPSKMKKKSKCERLIIDYGNNVGRWANSMNTKQL